MTDQAPINQASAGNDEEKPLDPAVERVRRKMMRLMVISVGIMMIGLMAVLFAIVYKISDRNDPPAQGGAMFETVLKLPAGGKIVSQSLSGDRLTLLVEHVSGRQVIFLFDTGKGRVVGRIDVNAQ